MVIKKISLIILSLTTLMISGCSNTKTTKINVLATTDLHGLVPYNMTEYINKEREKDSNITLVDAGDFLIMICMVR